MSELITILCSKCGFHEYEYDSAWKEYSCKKCGWIVQDAEKIFAIERTMGKALKQDQAMVKKPSGRLEGPKTVQSPVVSYPYLNSLTVSPSNEDVAWVSLWEAKRFNVSVLSPSKQSPRLVLDFASPRKPAGYMGILRFTLFVDSRRLLVASPLLTSWVRLVLIDAESGRELASKEVPNFAFYSLVVNNAGDTVAAKIDQENLLVVSITADMLTYRVVRVGKTYGPEPYFAPDGRLYAYLHQNFFRIEDDRAIHVTTTAGYRSVAFDLEGKVYFGGGFYDRSGPSSLEVFELNSGKSHSISLGREPIDVITPLGDDKLLFGNMVDERNAFQYSKSHVSLLRVSEQKKLWSIELTDIAPHHSPILLSVPEEGWALLESGRLLKRVSLDNGEILEVFPKEKPEFIQAQWLGSYRMLCVSRNRSKDEPGKLDIYRID